jgi:hypothetical protein
MARGIRGHIKEGIITVLRGDNSFKVSRISYKEVVPEHVTFA